MIVRTAAGTARCTLCRQEWIAEGLEEHADPQCLMWVLGRDMLVGSQQEGEPE